MKRIFFLTSILCALAMPSKGLSQKKIKTSKNPVAWSYEISPKTPMNESLRTFSSTVNTRLDPMDFWDEMNWALQIGDVDSKERARHRRQAVRDTIAKWSAKYFLNSRPFVRTNSNPDFFVELNTDTFKMEHVQLDVDYSDQESILGEVNVAARLTVKTAQGEILLDEEIRFYIDDPDAQTTQLRLRHLIFNPSFKLKYKLTKKPEKKRKLLEKRIKKFEADILEYFMEEEGNILKDHFLTQRINAYSAFFGVKNKGFDALNDASNIAESAVHAISALSKKKRRSLNEVQSDLKYARDHFIDKLTRTSDSVVQNVLNANLATVLLILGDVETARNYIENIPEFKELGSKTIWEGSFTYYLRGLAEAIALKEQVGQRAVIYQYDIHSK